MAATSDVRDILELEGGQDGGDFMTKDALFNDARKVWKCSLVVRLGKV